MNAMTQADLSREFRVVEILEELDLSPQHLEYVKKVNPSSGLPYHGYQHLLTVATACYESGMFYSSGSKDDARILFLAGLYHDWNHSGGTYSDSVNIAQAIVGMTQSVKTLETFDNATISQIASLIAATEYPSVREPKTTLEKIILDADKLQWVEKDFDRWAEGLGSETQTTITWESTKKFLKSQTIHTIWARTKLFDHQLLSNAW